MPIDLSDISLVDHHCHAIVTADRRQDVETLLRVTSEAPNSYNLSELQHRPIWHAVLKRITESTNAKVTSLQDVSSQMEKINYDDYCKSLFNSSGYERLFIDTGFSPDSSLDLETLGTTTGTQTHPVMRLEHVAEIAFQRTKSFSEWWEYVSSSIQNAKKEGYVGAKSIVAYRCGLSLMSASLAEAKEAYRDWVSTGANRLSDARLLRFLVWESAPMLAKQSLPLQFHTGYGDPDTDLRLGNPLLLRHFIEQFTQDGLSIVLLHTYPYHREAGYLASVYDNVYFDTSLIVPLGLTAARRVIAEALELAPYTRYLFASDAHTRPEIFAIAADLFRDAFGKHLEDEVLSQYTSMDTRMTWAAYVMNANAKRLYLGMQY